jgi:tRNA(Leu) C34 or U34 (ribose-2'-O)-methylase TrmL
VFRVVLFEPEIPPNTGNAIRLAANTGAELHLVKPLGFDLDRRSLRRAGLDYAWMARVHVHEDLDACLRSLDVAATGARCYAVETGGAPSRTASRRAAAATRHRPYRPRRHRPCADAGGQSQPQSVEHRRRRAL